MEFKQTEINYVIKFGELYLKSIGFKGGLQFTQYDTEAKHYRLFEDELEKTHPIADDIRIDVEGLFNLGMKDIKIIEIKKTVEVTEQEVIFEVTNKPTDSIKMIPKVTKRGKK